MAKDEVKSVLMGGVLQNDYADENTFNRFYFKLTDYVNVFISWVAGIALTLMMLLVVFNAIKRVFSAPFAGTVEVVGWLAAISVTFSLGYAQLNKSHIYIDFLVNSFNVVVRKIVHSLMNIFSIVFFALVVWYLIDYGLTLKGQGTLSETLQFAFYPIVMFCSIGFLGLVLAIIKETIVLWR